MLAAFGNSLLKTRDAAGFSSARSAKGGTSIEELAAKSPEAIVKMAISPTTGRSCALALLAGRCLAWRHSVRDSRSLLRCLASAGEVDPKAFAAFASQMGLGENADLKQQLLDVLESLLQLFKERDCLLLEINPLVQTSEGGAPRLVCADCKVNVDDNARFRQKEVFALRDSSQENENETAAEKLDLNYIKLDGNIACMVNGAGLAMATMDLIKLKGGAPANFLDVGGGAHEEQILGALRIIQRDADSKCLLINIFGGIMKCDIIAKGLVKALKELQFPTPIVVSLITPCVLRSSASSLAMESEGLATRRALQVRLEGTNKDKASEILDKELVNHRLPCGTPQVTFCRGFDEAASAAVRLANARL